MLSEDVTTWGTQLTFMMKNIGLRTDLCAMPTVTGHSLHSNASFSPSQKKLHLHDGFASNAFLLKDVYQFSLRHDTACFGKSNEFMSTSVSRPRAISSFPSLSITEVWLIHVVRIKTVLHSECFDASNTSTSTP